jgi:hypothetical protein
MLSISACSFYSCAAASRTASTASTASVVQFDDEEDEDLVTVTTTILGGGSVNVRICSFCLHFILLWRISEHNSHEFIVTNPFHFHHRL